MACVSLLLLAATSCFSDFNIMFFIVQQLLDQHWLTPLFPACVSLREGKYGTDMIHHRSTFVPK